jgi:hypothetical protein
MVPALLAAAFLIRGALGQFLSTLDELNSWLESTNASVTYRGNDWSTPRTVQDVRLIACSERIPNTNTCGGICYAFRGLQNGQCVSLPEGRNATCLAATADVGGCTDRQCTSSCFAYTTCKATLDYGFCDVGRITSIDTQDLGASYFPRDLGATY